MVRSKYRHPAPDQIRRADHALGKPRPSGQVAVIIENKEIIAGIHRKTAVVQIGYLHGASSGSAEIDQLFLGLLRRFYPLGNQYGPLPLINGMVFTLNLCGNANPALIFQGLGLVVLT